MELGFAVDWIRATTKHHSIKQMIDRFSYGFAFDDWASFKPKEGYDCGLQNPYGHQVMWCTYRDDMGVNVQFPGRSCHELHHAGIDVLEIVQELSEDAFKFTRLDLAIDLKGVYIDIPALLDCEHTGSANNDPELYVKGRKARGGATLYIGSRQSDKYVRIYDKAKERKLKDVLWVRLEIELKKATATKIAKMLVGKSELEAGIMAQQMIKGVYNPDHAALQEALRVEPMRVGSTKNEEHNTYDWIMGSVSKTLARLIIELPHRDVEETFLKEVRKHIRELAAKSLNKGDDSEMV